MGFKGGWQLVKIMSVYTYNLQMYTHYVHYRFNMAKSCISHELIELSHDEESTGRIASLETLIDLLDFFDKTNSIFVWSLPFSKVLTEGCYYL